MPRTKRSAGFSLIELIIVLVLMAVAAAMATFSLRGVRSRQKLARGVEIVQQFDAALRRSALVNRRGARGEVNRSGGQMTIEALNQTYKLPDPLKMQEFRIGGSGREVTVFGDGSSPTYAVKLSTGNASRWVLLIGGSGQLVSDADDSLVNAMVPR